MTSELRLDIRQQQPFALTAALRCRAGELLALLGPSGCGKSTLLRMIAGLQHAESGIISLNGSTWFSDSTRLKPQQRRIGYVPQHYGLFPHMTALQNVTAALHGLPRQEQLTRARAWLDKVQLAAFMQRKPAELSGGQQQRVALARALAAQPSILLLDEPFSALDSITRDGLYRILAALKPQLNIPIILVTHSLNEAQLLADKIAVMGQGCILQEGESDRVVRQPLNRAVAALIGMRNICSGTITRTSGDHSVLAVGEQELVLPRALPAGATLHWCLPQEAIRLASLADEPGCLAGNINDLVRLGERWLVSVRLPGTSDTLELHCPATKPLALHQPIRLAVDTGQLHILEA
ncbi:ABC transporter ATP-binding protein [Methylobacillus flagellatus]|uniref:ABC transporter related protein n=1 Tax=Methylobacillus flagellatus (strain ATCC 51484 / DSM 6875 / VKM B-1610 / KT) TaxID=265072 RepID=Q1H1H6_METFK|nr:ABC transporter ATP-binding protein [Methylobacillus flagellatus]ABE49661.1 ABC transporter related protein [Methylobacillus flagellatus KT]